MSTVTIIVGTVLGGTEYVADEIAQQLTDLGITNSVHTDYQDPQQLINEHLLWLICTSTHGAGDLPDNIQPLADYIAINQPDLSKLKYGLIGIGDSSYDTFNYAAKKLDKLLQSHQATRLSSPLLIDIQDLDYPEDTAKSWMNDWIEQYLTQKTCG